MQWEYNILSSEALSVPTEAVLALLKFGAFDRRVCGRR